MAGTPARAARGSADSYRAVPDESRHRIEIFRVRPTTSAAADPADSWARSIGRDAGSAPSGHDSGRSGEEARRDAPREDRPRYERRESSEAERARAVAEVRASIGASGLRIAAALSISCPVCAAAKGAYCFPAPHGFCRERWDKALGLAVPPVQTGEPEGIARAQRNSIFHRRQRPRDIAARQIRGGVR